MQKKTLKNHMTCTYNFTIWYEIAESYDISFTFAIDIVGMIERPHLTFIRGRYHLL
jgi:hypothetical protein